MPSEQATSQLEVGEQPKSIKIIKEKKYETLYIKEKERNDNLEKINKYLSAKINIFTNNQNNGEKNEVLLLMKLYYFNEINQYGELIEIFGEDAEGGITLIDISNNTIINDINKIKKAKGMFKADCIIKLNKTGKQIYPSIKYKNGGTPSVMNHQRRDQPVFQSGGDLNYLLSDIDRIVRKYHDLRNEGLPAEIKFEKLHNFMTEDKKVLSELIWYFMFKGSGNNTSKQMADSLLIIEGINTKYISLINKQEQIKYINDNWNLFDISLVSHKNLSGITFKDEIEEKCMVDLTYKQKYDIMKPWIYETTDDGKHNPENKIKLKTALHIRMN